MVAMTRAVCAAGLAASRASVRLKKVLARAGRRDARARYFTYTLLLSDNRVYVGSTDNIYGRLLEHYLMSPSSSVWVREHGPVRRVLEIVEDSAAEDEAYKTLEYMSLFGWESVRGGGWCRAAMRGPPAALADFQRTRADFRYMDRPEIAAVVDHVAALAQDLREPEESDASDDDGAC
jgi:predicted GIY-YIG superfamily endonuclease